MGYLTKHRDRLQNDLVELATIPSISAIPEYSEACLKAAQWLEARLRAAGLEVCTYKIALNG